MVIIVDLITKQVKRNIGTNSMFPDGNIPNVELQPNEQAVKIHDNSPLAQIISLAMPGYYDLVFNELGEAIDVVVTKTIAEYQTPSLSETQQQKILELNIACNQEILNGFSSSCTGLSHQYKFDMEYQGNFSKKMGLLALVPTIQSVDWPTKDMGVVEHTREQFIQLIIDGQTHMETKIFRYFGMKAQIEACETVEAVNEFVW